MATVTIFGDLADGYVQAPNATGPATSVQTSSLQAFVGQGSGFCIETCLAFDTSTVVSPTAVTLSLYGDTDASTTDFTVEVRLYDWGTTLTTADWVAGSGLAALTLLATWATTGWVAAYNDFTESGSAFASHLNLSGFTRILLHSDRQRTGLNSGGNEYVSFIPSDATGTTQDPKIVVTYSSVTNATATPAVAAGVAAVGSPTVSTGANATATPAKVSGAAAAGTPTLSTGQKALPATAAAAATVGAPTTTTGGGGGGGPDLFNEHFEGTNGAAVTTSNSVFTSLTGGSIFTFDSGEFHVGATALKIAETNSPSYATITLPSKTTYYFRTYWRAHAGSWPKGVGIFNIPSIAGIGVRAVDGKILLSGNGQAITTTVIAVDTWYRIEWEVDTVAHNHTVRLFFGANIEGTTPDESKTWTSNAGTPGSIQVGETGFNQTGTVQWYDDFAGDDTAWIGPATSGATNATATPAVAAATAAVGAPTTTAAKTATTTPATVAAVSAVAAPVVSTGTKAFPAAAVAIAAVGAPSTSTGTKALPVRVTAASAVTAPTISTGQKAMPTTVVAAAAVGVPTVAATSFATITPTTIVAAAGVGSPSVTAARAAAATPSTVASAAMVAAPTVSAASNSTATPATAAAAATISAPAISAGQRSLPATVPATAAVAGPATTTATAGTAHPATVTASTTAATPTVATGSRTVPLTFLATTAVPAPTVHIGTSMVPATVELLAAIGDPGVVTVTVAHITTPVFAVAVGSGRSAAPVAVSAVGAAVAANGRGGVNVDPSSTGSVLSGDGRTLAEVS